MNMAKKAVFVISVCIGLCLPQKIALSDEWQFKINSADKQTVLDNFNFTIVNDIKPETDKPETDKSEYYLVKFTADWCGLCTAFDKSGKLNQLKQHMPVSIVDTDKVKTWNKQIKGLPEFWLVKRSNRQKVFSWYGNADVNDIINRYNEYSQKSNNESKDTVSVTTTTITIYNGKKGNSHQNRQTLIGHLLNDGIHKNRHSLSELNNMSDYQLDELHNRDHNW